MLENSKITPKDINGVSQIRAELIMELRNDLEPNEVNYQVIDNIKNFKSNTIIKGRTLSAKELRFEGNNQEFLVSGNAFLDEFPFTYSWNKKHGVTFNDESIVNGTLTLSRESFKALNVEIPNEMMIGEANADFKIALKKDAYPDISVFSNLVGTELNIKSLDWKKKADESGELLLTMTLKEGPEDINFKLTAPRLKAIADFDLSLEGKVKSLNFSNLKITNKFNGQVKVTPKTSSSGTVIGVTSPELDIRNYTFSSDNRTSDTVIYLDISKLIINDLVSLNDLNGKFNNTDIVDSYFTGNINSCLLYTSPSPRDQRGWRMPSCA